MKAKLIKDHTDYHLVDDKQFIIGTTDKVMLSCTDKQKLSLKNCQAIERGYDLDELAKTIFPDKIFTINEEYETPIDGFPYQWGFKVGFQKALELIGDKKFSEEDVKNIFAKTLENAPSMESHTRMISDEQYRHSVMDELYDRITKSLQQTEWDVEIEMDAIPADRAPGGWDRFPKLDADGCLILKPLSKE